MQSETTIPILSSKVNLLFSQFRRENESWRRTLEFLIEEDIILKASISEILKNMNQTDEVILKRLEHFHSLLLKENDTVRLLRTDVSDIERKLKSEFFDSDLLPSIKHHQNRLRKEIETAELDFLKLKFNFNEYIDGILQDGS